MNTIRNINRNLIADNQRSLRLPRFVGENPEPLKERQPADKPFVSGLERTKRRVAITLPVIPNFVHR